MQGFDIGKAYDQAIKDNNFERALIATRADITQYTIWHKTNTAPALGRISVGPGLLRIDVNALGAYVSRLSWLYFRLGLTRDWLATLDRLRANVQHPSWYRKIVRRAVGCQNFLVQDAIRLVLEIECPATSLQFLARLIGGIGLRLAAPSLVQLFGGIVGGGRNNAPAATRDIALRIPKSRHSTLPAGSALWPRL
ncbi:hypothetical protein [Bradyrhizobium sp. USDA 336]|uniref:hypothetical protein n=1 Tax=Bradyrhizobium sp. USDA 336 TaxID=3156311 RepID=UPI003838F597